MLQNDSNTKKNSIMKNIQKLRNEIEEIRIQNLSLIEDLKPYEEWYDNTKEILFSSYKTRRRPEMSRSNSLSHYFSVSSSSSLSSESSDTEIKSQPYENQKSSDSEEDEVDDFFSDDEYLQKKGTTTSNKKTTSNQPQTPIPQSPALPNQLLLNSIKILNQKGNNTSYPLSNTISLQNKSPALHPGMPNLAISLLNRLISQKMSKFQQVLPVYNASQNFNQSMPTSTSPIRLNTTIQSVFSPQKKTENTNVQTPPRSILPNSTSKQIISSVNSPNTNLTSTSNSIKNQFDLLINPPPIYPNINISEQKVSDSNENEEQKEQSDDKNKEQIIYKTILTPIVKIDLK